MIDQQIQDYCRLKGFHEQTLQHWLKLSESDRQALVHLAQTLTIGENHFKDILEWLEEIALRDGASVAQILSRDALRRIASDPRRGRNDKVKRIKDELRRQRFPRLARIEEEIHRRVREMKLKPQFQLTVPAGLEGGAVTIGMKAASYDELKRLSAELARVVDQEGMKEIFALLRGEQVA
ncbi:MAG TPA: hypothetical protein VGL70_08315 [Candidatus Binatia bacterium]|jgi:hypothetical protein